MKSTARLYQCVLCHNQVVICSHCDHGHIYCGTPCATTARKNSCKKANQRYQKTKKGKMNNALRQKRFRERLKNLVTDHGSTDLHVHAPIQGLENRTKKSEIEHKKRRLICGFCKKTVSEWIRNDFLQRKTSKKTVRFQRTPQAP